MNFNYIDIFTKELNKYFEKSGVKNTVDETMLIVMDNMTKYYSVVNEVVEKNNKKTTENLNDYFEFQKKLIDSISQKESLNILNQNKIVFDYIKMTTTKTLDDFIGYTEDIKKKL